ncbi:MAG: hypothetical protein MZV70_46180 [Desulfobacterales bacterium]|nr:hypothetical protein [Desulfobacterales bacterium]
MINALKRLAKDNLSNLHPHPLYVWFYYSHPPLIERIEYLQKACNTQAAFFNSNLCWLRRTASSNVLIHIRLREPIIPCRHRYLLNCNSV